MSTSLLYHAWGLRGYRYLRTDFIDGTIQFMVEPQADHFCCSHCGSGRVSRAGQMTRRFKSLPIGGRAVTIVVPIQRLACGDCGKTRQPKLDLADPRVSYTKAFERYALELSSYMTILDVACHLGVGWDTIKDIQKRYLHKRFAKPKLKKLRQIAIDEISIGKGHRYLTVVLDLVRGAVVFVGEGRGAETLQPFWKRLRRARARIEAVATDMSPAYSLAVHDNLPQAVHVFDRFHVVKLFNDKLSELRRDVQHAAQTLEHKRVLKGTRWLLLKNPENLDETRNERQRLQDALRINQPLATAYYLKEDLRQFWQQANKAQAERFLRGWIARAEASGVRMLQQFAKTLMLHRRGLLAWYDYPISTGPLEGTNNKIKTLQRQAYGFRDQEFFKLKIFALHEATYALVG